jgi:hypothetical protein
MSADITVECLECPGEYHPDDEDPEDHDPNCIIREAMIGRGRWDDPEVSADGD